MKFYFQILKLLILVLFLVSCSSSIKNRYNKHSEIENYFLKLTYNEGIKKVIRDKDSSADGNNSSRYLKKLETLESPNIEKQFDSLIEAISSTQLKENNEKIDSNEIPLTTKTETQNTVLDKKILMFRDSSISINYFGTIVYNPKTFTSKRWYRYNNVNKFYTTSIPDHYLSKWQPEIQINIDSSKTKIINGFKCVYFKIIEKIQTYSSGEIININEGYADFSFKIPFNNYNFLELKFDIKLSGLIVDNQSYLGGSDFNGISESNTLEKIEFKKTNSFSLREFILDNYGADIKKIN